MPHDNSKRRKRASTAGGDTGSTNDAGSYIDYTVNVDPVNTLFHRIASVLAATLRWFNRVGQIVFIHPIHGLKVVTSSTLNGYLSPFVEIRFWAKSGAKKLHFKRFGLLPRDMVGPFIEAPQVAHQLQPLKRYTRTPLFDDQWHLVNEPGYNADAQIYYDGPVLTPVERAPLLTKVLSEFCWKTPADRVNVIGALLTALTILRWPGKHPLVVCSANQSGLGKTLLARLMAATLDGAEHLIGFHSDEEEFEKQVATGIEPGNRVLIVDNVRVPRGTREIASGVLERCVTAVTLMFRRLGTNTPIVRPNDVLFVLTMNKARLSADLRRRSLPVTLYYDGNAGVRLFSIGEPAEFVRNHQRDVLAELLGMVVLWLQAGQPMPSRPARHSVSNEWAATIDAILQFNGYCGFLANLDEANAEADPDYHALLDICEACHGDGPKTALAWARHLNEKGLLRDQLFDPQSGFPKPDHSQATIVGTLFTKYLATELMCPSGVFRLRATDRGKSHASVEYWFEPVAPESEDYCDRLAASVA